jgi:hypothetical protein
MKITQEQWRDIIRKRTLEMENIKTKYNLSVSDYIRDQYIYDMRGITVRLR